MKVGSHVCMGSRMGFVSHGQGSGASKLRGLQDYDYDYD